MITLRYYIGLDSATLEMQVFGDAQEVGTVFQSHCYDFLAGPYNTRQEAEGAKTKYYKNILNITEKSALSDKSISF